MVYDQKSNTGPDACSQNEICDSHLIFTFPNERIIAKLTTNEIALQIKLDIAFPSIFKTAKEEKVVKPPANPAIQKSRCSSLDLNLKITSPANKTPS